MFLRIHIHYLFFLSSSSFLFEKTGGARARRSDSSGLSSLAILVKVLAKLQKETDARCVRCMLSLLNRRNPALLLLFWCFPRKNKRTHGLVNFHINQVTVIIVIIRKEFRCSLFFSREQRQTMQPQSVLVGINSIQRLISKKNTQYFTKG